MSDCGDIYNTIAVQNQGATSRDGETAHLFIVKSPQKNLLHPKTAPKKQEARLLHRVGLRCTVLVIKTQVGYTVYGTVYQVCLPMNMGIICMLVLIYFIYAL